MDTQYLEPKVINITIDCYEEHLMDKINKVMLSHNGMKITFMEIKFKYMSMQENSAFELPTWSVWIALASND